MKRYINPKSNLWTKLTVRPLQNQNDLHLLVDKVFNDIKKYGDNAVLKYSKLFDKANVNHLDCNVSESEIKNLIPNDLKKAINEAKNNIEKFHKAQLEKFTPIETSKGVICWRENRPIEKVGIYIPGGSAPLFSTVLMLGLPAKIAGCKEIVLCSPPNKNGQIHPTILYTAKLIGINKIFCVGGIQAIGALTFGTQSIPKVYKIVGPGNQYVMAAKQKATEFGVAIDMPAGPSELLVIADHSCKPEYVATDLLSQAEHGTDSQVLLLTTNSVIADNVMYEIKKQLVQLPRKHIVKEALKNSKIIVFNDLETCIKFSNCYAPEHLILAVKNPKKYLKQIINAGSIFLGNYSCESAGDYASGTNHTLPTNGFSKNYSGVSVDSFIKKITVQNITKKGIKNLSSTIQLMAEAEQLIAHKNAVSIRLKK